MKIFVLGNVYSKNVITIKSRRQKSRNTKCYHRWSAKFKLIYCTLSATPWTWIRSTWNSCLIFSKAVLGEIGLSCINWFNFPDCAHRVLLKALAHRKIKDQITTNKPVQKRFILDNLNHRILRVKEHLCHGSPVVIYCKLSEHAVFLTSILTDTFNLKSPTPIWFNRSLYGHRIAYTSTTHPEQKKNETQ